MVSSRAIVVVNQQKAGLLALLLYVYVGSLSLFGYSLYNLEERGLARPDMIIGGLMMLVFGLRLLTKRLTLAQSPVNKFALLFLYTGMLSSVNLFNATGAQLIDFGTKGVQMIWVVAIFFTISSLPFDLGSLERVFRVWVLTAFAVSAYGVYQILARAYDLPFAYVTLSNPTVAPGFVISTRSAMRYVQPTSVFREPGWMASFLIGPLLFSGILSLTGKSESFLFKRRWLNSLVVGTIGLGVVLSGALGAYVSLPMTLAIMYILRIAPTIHEKASTKLFLLILVLFLLAGFVLLELDIDFLHTTLFRIEALIRGLPDPLSASPATSLTNRFVRAQAGLRVWISHPILGVGLNQMGYYTDVYPWAQSPWVQVLVDQGLLGFFALVLVFWSLLRELWRLSGRVSESSPWHPVVVGLLVVLILDIFDGLHTLNWIHPQRWFTLAMANLVYIQTSSTLSKHAQEVNTSLSTWL